MKALIIENEWEVDTYVQAFLKDNPTLFESVQEELHCLSRGPEELVQYVLANDAIIVASTFMYKDQLEDFLDAFLDPKFPVKKLFVHWITSTLNKWKLGWTQEKDLFAKVKQLVKKGCIIYDFGEDNEKSYDIQDDLGFYKGSSRAITGYWEVYYSEEHDLFYTEHSYHNLKSEIEDESDEIKRKR